jgi:hypothetical protein
LTTDSSICIENFIVLYKIGLRIKGGIMKNKLREILVYVFYGLIFVSVVSLLYFFKPTTNNAMAIMGNVIQLIAPFFAGFAFIFLFNPIIFGDSTRSMPWIFIGLGFLAWGFGQIAYTYMEVILNIDIPLFSIADIGYLLMYPLVFTGYFLELRLFRKIKITWWILVALAVFAGSYIFLIWNSFINASGLVLASQILYTVGDLGLVGGAIIIAYTTRGGFVMWSWILLLISGIIFAYGNAIFDYLENAGLYSTGHFVDLFWVIAFIVAWIGAHLFNSLMKAKALETK